MKKPFKSPRQPAHDVPRGACYGGQAHWLPVAVQDQRRSCQHCHHDLLLFPRVFERDRTVTFGFTGRHAGTTTPRTPCIPGPGIEPAAPRSNRAPLGPGRDFRFTIRERKGPTYRSVPELNLQGTQHARPASNRFPSGHRRVGGPGGPSVVSSMPRPGLEPRTSR